MLLTHSMGGRGGRGLQARIVYPLSWAKIGVEVAGEGSGGWTERVGRDGKVKRPGRGIVGGEGRGKEKHTA
eukprot:353115-Chlamydomonas_euryale.AAC.8